MFTAKLNEVLPSKSSFLRDSYNSTGLIFSIVLNIIHWAVLYYKIKPTSSPLLIHYNVVYGADLVDRAWFVYIIPASALLLLFLNWGLSAYFYRREKLASYFVNFSNVIVQIIFCCASLIVIHANG